MGRKPKSGGLLAMLLVTAACGNGQGTGVARQEAGDDRARVPYLEKVNAICRDMIGAFEEIERPATLDDVPSVASREMAVRADGIERIRALDPPDELREEAAQFVSDLERKQDFAQQVKEAAKRGQGSKLHQIENRGYEWHLGFLDRTREMGLDECTNV